MSVDTGVGDSVDIVLGAYAHSVNTFYGKGVKGIGCPSGVHAGCKVWRTQCEM